MYCTDTPQAQVQEFLSTEGGTRAGASKTEDSSDLQSASSNLRESSAQNSPEVIAFTNDFSFGPTRGI